VRALRASPDARLRNVPVVGLTVLCEWELLEAGANASLRERVKVPALGAVLSRVVRPPGRG
jgi:hypothetical protein